MTGSCLAACHLVDLLVPLQCPGERAGPRHRLAHLHLGVARLPHPHHQLTPGGDVLTDVKETLNCVVHGDLLNNELFLCPILKDFREYFKVDSL